MEALVSDIYIFATVFSEKFLSHKKNTQVIHLSAVVTLFLQFYHFVVIPISTFSSFDNVLPERISSTSLDASSSLKTLYVEVTIS